MFRPSREKAEELLKNYKRVPVSTEIFSDIRTPIEVLKILKKHSRHCYILESVEEQKIWGRYTFLGYDPVKEITCKDKMICLRDLKTGEVIEFKEEKPGEYLKEELKKNKSPRFSFFLLFQAD
jgi:anthranilate synthase component 1